MTTLSFRQSAVFPGNMPGQPWDFNWTQPATFKPGEYSEDYISLSATPVSYKVGVHPSIIRDGLGQTYIEQSVALRTIWNNVKDIRVSNISAQVLDVSNFVDTWIAASGDNQNRVVNIDVAKRGAVLLGDGNDRVRIGVAANEYSWLSHFDIVVGNGNDTVEVKPEAYSVLGVLQAPYGWVFNATPQLTTADVTVGGGNDTVSLAGVSGTIHVGDGNDRINITDGNTSVWLGRGKSVVTIAAPATGEVPAWAYDTHAGSSIVHVGAGHADIAIDDSDPSRTPLPTLAFIRGETGGDNGATADVVRCGHNDFWTSTFLGGDLGAVAIDLAGYSPGSTATLQAPAAADGPMLLQIRDATTGGVDALALYGATVTSVASLSLRFMQPGTAGQPSTRSSRWTISSRPRQPNMASIWSERWPAMRLASVLA